MQLLKLQKNQEVNDISKHTFDDILQEYEITELSAKNVLQENDNTDIEINEKELYKVDKPSFGDILKE